MRNIKMTLSYDGTAYHGFQDQGPGIPTIQRSLETAIHKLTGALACHRPDEQMPGFMLWVRLST